MNKATPCKKHPNFSTQWVRILQQNIDFGCIKCLDEIKDKLHIQYLPDVIQDPSSLIPHIPIEEKYKTLYNNLNEFQEQKLEKYYGQLEKSLISLCEYLKNFIQNGRTCLEEFKKKCKESKELLYQQFKINEIHSLIKQYELYENQDISDQIEKKLNDIREQVNEDLMKEQSSKIKKIYDETLLSIYKLNLNCNQQIDEISAQINNNAQELKQYFLESFKSIYRLTPYNTNQKSLLIQNQSLFQNISSLGIVQIEKSKFQFSENNFPYYSSRILPQYYFEYILQQDTFQQILGYNPNLNLKAYNIFEPKNQEIVNGQQFWNQDSKLKRQNREINAKLMIFKSNNKGNPIFGYFVSNGIEFIFSYTHNEIYPNKQMKQKRQNGLQFNPIKQQQAKNQIDSFIVGNYDMEIHANLIDGKSMLGQEFIWDSQNNEIDKSEYLFGGAKPNIQLCEIFYF
ncbi:unnamed protein product [Paramecium primaurelia]|uniref:TLDc domain-containing protein n=1 Tax=Paramecium primaurelia TaxID=5886 RepID=A0A8S1JMM2_PARPR|nr:unnamed protein product [Paramecium primaurelia]